MKLNDIHIYTYQLSLRDPLPIGNNILTTREGVIIQINTNTDLYGFGEAAPLKGLHRENLQEAIIQLKNIKPHLIETSLENIFATTNQLQHERQWFPSVQFAIESALLNLMEFSNNQGIMKKLPQSLQDKIFINTLGTGSILSIKKQIEKSLRNKYRSIKIKVGRKSLAEEINLIRDIQKKIGNVSTLRLDANRNWTFEEAVTFVGSIESESIEYIEEPLKDPEKLPDLFKKTNLPIALDESLVEITPEKFKYEDWINALIIKPAVLGSVQKTIQYIALAKKYGIKSVISDTFHSGIGLSFLIRLASTITEATTMGFDTYSWLKEDILVNRLPVKDGYFNLNTVLNYSRNVNISKLVKVA